MSSVVWCGPVNLAQVPGATVPGAKNYNVQCLGDRTPRCRTIANTWLSGGQRLPTMLAKIGATGPNVDPLYLGAFSAGGIVGKLVCESALDRRRIRAVMLCDAIYGGLGDNEGFVAYAVEAITQGNRMMVSTHSSSGGTGTTPSNIRMREVKTEIERRLNAQFEELPPETWTGIVKQLPVQLWRLGSVWLADYKATIGHGHTVLAPGLWQNLLVPWDRDAPPLPNGEEPGGVLPLPAGGSPMEPTTTLSGTSTAVKAAAMIGCALVGYSVMRFVS